MSLLESQKKWPKMEFEVVKTVFYELSGNDQNPHRWEKRPQEANNGHVEKRSDKRLEYPSNGRDSKTHWPDAENNARDHRGRRGQNPLLSL